MPNRGHNNGGWKCGVVRRILVSQFRVLRTGTLFEIRNDNLQFTVMGFKNQRHKTNNS